MKDARGFTLIEVVIAISIFALLGFGCYKVVHGLSLARDKLSQNSEELRSFSKSLSIINDDLTQLTPRKIRDESGKSQPAFTTKDDYLLEFSRLGVQNPLMKKRAKVMRVAYQFDKEADSKLLKSLGDEKAKNPMLGDGKQGYLIRYVWPVLDRGNNDEPTARILLTGINDVELEYMDENGRWITSWPPSRSEKSSNQDDEPYAIKIKITTQKYGVIERFFVIHDFPKAA